MPLTASWLQRLGSQARTLFQTLHRTVVAEGPHLLAQGMTGLSTAFDVPAEAFSRARRKLPGAILEG